MTRALLLGLKPEAVGYSDPALPPGMNAEKLQAAETEEATAGQAEV